MLNKSLLALAYMPFESIDFKILMLAVFIFVAVIFSGFAWMLSFHWKNYSFNTPVIRKMKKLFLTVSGILLSGSLIFLIIF
ncbi:MAG TPA: hypothetical protein VJC12_01910 [Candidatus Paceibacterota bacterium]